MIQLGLSGFYHDSAACIVIDGKVVAAIEEEKLSGIKHDSSFPFKAIEWCLQYTQVSIDEVNMVCWYEDPNLKFNRVKNTLGKWYGLKHNRKFNKFLKRWNQNEGALEYLLLGIGYDGPILYTKHHISHLAFSYYTSPFDKATGISIDGVGEWDTMSVVAFNKTKIYERKTLRFPDSLGLVYSTITSYLGFKPNEGEYKVMGLAPYGDNALYENIFSKITEYGDAYDVLKIKQKYFTWEYSNKDMFTNKLIKLIGFPPRFEGEPIEQHHKDLAAALQRWYESKLYFIINRFLMLSTDNNLVLGGGCAYNATANGKIKKTTSVNNLWIPYAPSDAGSAIGSCLYHYHSTLGHPKVKGGDNQSPYLGPEFTELDILNELGEIEGLSIYPMDNKMELCTTVAKLINDGNVIGWFQGRTEFGARALGNRSILANPHLPDVRDRINKVIKKREMFRPFAPSVTIEDYSKYFISDNPVPYMNQVVMVKSDINIPSVTHIDGTARIHTVERKDNPLYYNLLREFEKVSGTPILLNTSLNINGETMVNDPKKAIWTLQNSDMDYLVLGNYLISK